MAFAAASAASGASAQPWVSTERAGALSSLAAEGAAQSPLVFSNRDDGDALVSLPFSFWFFDEPVTSIRVGVNGQVRFGGAAATSLFNVGIDDSGVPDRLLAPWWDDLILPAASGHAGTAVLGRAPNRVFVIEVRDLERFPFDGRREIGWQLRLHEGLEGRFELSWNGAATEPYRATAGYVGPGGRPRSSFRPCGAIGTCGPADHAGLSGRTVEVGRAPGPDLAVSLGALPPGALPGGGAALPITIANVGTQATPPFEVVVELAPLTGPGPSDPELGRLSFDPLPARSARTRTATLAVAASVALGRYRLVARADPAGAVPDPDPSNDVAVGAQPFFVGHDLAVAAVQALAAAPVGAPFSVMVQVEQLGLPYAGPVEIAVYASPNQVPNPSDPVIARVNVAAAPTISVAGTIPANAPGRFWPLAVVDPGRRLPDFDRANDGRAGPTPVLTVPNLQVASIRPVGAGALPGALLAVEVEVAQLGPPIAGPVPVALYASTDPVLDASDPPLGSATVPLGAPSSVSLTVPALPPGRWHAIARVNPDRSVPELSFADNVGVSAQTFATAPNLRVAAVTPPSTATPGQPFSATVRISSDALPYSGPVRCRWFLSEDPALDPSDLVLGDFDVVFAAEAERTASPSTTLPAGLARRRWYVLVVADFPNAIAEADETDNFGASTRTADAEIDLRLSSVVSAPAAVDIGEAFTVDFVALSSPGPYFGPVPYRIALGRSTSLLPGDPTVGTGTVAFAGTRETVTGAIGRAPTEPGPWRVFVELDPEGLIEESNEDNNSRSGFGTLRVRGPDLSPRSLLAPASAVAGTAVPVSFEIENLGDAAAAGVTWRLALAVSGSVPRELEVDGPVQIGPGAVLPVQTTARLPPESGQGELVVLIDSLAEELDRGNNRASRPIVVEPRRALFRIEGARAATVAAAGEPWGVSWVAANEGVEAGRGSVEVSLLPEGRAPIPVGRTDVRLEPGEIQLGWTAAELPSDLAPGLYGTEVRLGLDRDPGPRLEVLPASLRIRTEALEPAAVGRTYRQWLRATGDPERWSLVGLGPPGLALRASGLIEGTPTEAGRFSVTARAEAGNARAERSYELLVRTLGAPLALSPAPLEPAWIERPYTAQLVALGGLPPLRFTASGLPAGLSLDEATGRISGIPLILSTRPLDVRVSDADGEVAEARIRFAVLHPERKLRILAPPLPDALLGRGYCDEALVELSAVGGLAPLEWSARELPPGFLLSPDGRLCGTPTERGRFVIEVELSDAAQQIDRAELPIDVVAASQLVLQTVGWPPVSVGSALDLALLPAGGEPPYRFALTLGALPPGVELTGEGRLVGAPAEAGLYSFGVELSDQAGALRAFPLSLEVRPAPESCVAARSFGPWALLGLLFRRRRRGPRLR